MVIIIGQEKNEERGETIDATPTAKGTYLALISAGYTLPDAVAEYVDNSIEQARINGDRSYEARNVEVSLKTEGGDGIIEILDNCGGCPKKDAVRFVRPGDSGVDPEEGSISRFGIGGKAAGLAVSNSVEILSRSHSEKGWKIILKRDEILDKMDWKFKIMELNKNEEIKEGTTKIKLHVSDYSDFQNFPIKGRVELEERYGLKDLSSVVNILFEGVKINNADPEIEILNKVESPEHCDPLETKDNLRVPTKEKNTLKTREISVKIKLGLMTEGSRINKFGMNIYCNGRLLVKDNKIGVYDQSYDEGKIGHAGSQLIWLRGVIYLNGPAEAMPWNSRKSDLDTTSPTYRKLEELVKNKINVFLEKMGKSKKELKDKTGEKKLPDIRDVIVDHYVRELKRDINYENKIRDIVKNSKPFKDAKRKLESKKGVGFEGDPQYVPSPPQNKENVYLAANIEKEKVEEVKEKIAKAYGKTNVTNADVIRITLEHYNKCAKI